MKKLIRNKFTLAAIALAVLQATHSANLVAAEGAVGAIQVETFDKEVNRNLAGVTIIVTDRLDNSSTYQVGEDGRVTIPQLKPGLYSVKAVKDGYLTVVESSLRVTSNKVTSTRFLMPLSNLDDDIETISVTGRQSVKSESEPVSTTYMDREQLRSAVGGGSDVLRALDGMPGLTSTGDFAAFSVRGRGQEDNLIYVDNMPFDKVVHFDASLGELENIGGGGRFSIFAPNLIQGAEFSPGGWGAAYGGKAGSLLKLDVIDGAQTPSASLRVDLAGLEVGYEGPSGIDDDTSIVFNARHLDFGNFFDVIGENDIGDPRMSDVLFKSVTEIGNEHSVEFLLLHSPEEFRRDLEHVVESEDLEENISYLEQDSTLVGVTWHALVGQTSELSTNLYYRISDKFSSQGESYPDLVPPATPYNGIPVRRDLLTLSEDETEIGLRTDFATFNQFGELTAGAEVRSFDLTFETTLREEWQRFIYAYDDYRPSPDQKYIVLQPDSINSAYDISAISYAAYVDQAYEFDYWQVNTGVRYDYDDLAEQHLLSPRLNISWFPTSTSRYSLTTGLFYQAPSFLDRASDPANASLENEKITHFSLGGDWRLSENYNLLAEAYYQKLDKLVVDSNRTDGLLSNNGEGESYGFDTVLTRHFSDDWSADATYSYNQSTRNDNDGEGDYDADYHRSHVFSIGAKWEINDAWKVGARWKYFTGTPADEYITHDNVLGDGNPQRFSKEYTTNNTERNDDFHQLNVRLDYYRTFGDVNVIAFLDIVNVLGTSVDGEESFDVKTGEVLDEDGDIMPMIGLKFETTF